MVGRLEARDVMRPGVRAHARLLLAGDVAQVLAIADSLIAHGLRDRPDAGLRTVVVRVPEEHPAILGDALKVSVRVLHDKPAQTLGVPERDAEADRRT